MKTAINTYQTFKGIAEGAFKENTLPSVAFRNMSEEQLVTEFKPLAILRGNMQREDWHPEGDCFEHSLQVLDAKFLLIQAKNKEKYTLEEKVAMLVAALVHDFGKAVTQEWNEDRGHYNHIGHEKKGVAIVKAWLEELGEEAVTKWGKLVLFMTEHHGIGHAINTWGTKKFFKFVEKVEKEVGMDKYILMISADTNGRVSKNDDFLKTIPKELHQNAELLQLGLVAEEKVRDDENNLLTDDEKQEIIKQVESNKKIPVEKLEGVKEKRLKKEQENRFTDAIEALLASVKSKEAITM